MTEQEILTALVAGPKTITDLAGGSMAYRDRAPIRAAIDALMAAGSIRRIGLEQSRAFVLYDWRVTDEFLMAHFVTRMRREGQHLIWEGNWGATERGTMKIDGERYDVRRTLYRIKRGRALKPGESVRAKCEHETCMAAACQVVHKAKGSKGPRHSVATRAKQAAVKRARSKYSPELVAAVKASTKSYKQIALETGMKLSTVGAIKAGRLRKDYSSPWAGLWAR